MHICQIYYTCVHIKRIQQVISLKYMKARECFGHNLKRLRKEKGFKSSRAFAEHIGVSTTSVARYEAGMSLPQELTIHAIAMALNCEESELFGFNEHAEISIEKAIQKVNEALGYKAPPKTIERESDIPEDILSMLEGLNWSNENIEDTLKVVLEGLSASQVEQKKTS